MTRRALRVLSTRSVLALALLGLGLSGCDKAPLDAPPAEAPAYERTSDDELVVDLVDGTTLPEFLDEYPQLTPEQVRWNSPNVEDEGIAVVRAPRSQHEALLAAMRQDDEVESAENNALLRLPTQPTVLAEGERFLPDDGAARPTDAYPNDTFYERQWNMRMVHAREAWHYASGEDVIVAVIDTGVAYEDASGKGLWAPDLKDTRFVAGYDFVNDDAVPADDQGHGTHCAGTIAQSTDNGKGVIGLAPQCKIMPLKVLNQFGFGSLSDIADAIRYAADHGAHVLSLSLGGGGYSRVLASAVQYAHDRGCVVVCAAGNAARPRVEYPAAYRGALAVSSVGPSGKLAFYSSYGKQIFIAAPGGDMKRKVEDGVLQNTLHPFRKKHDTVYAYYQGTSMATPHVAGASALLYSAGVTRPDGIAEILARSAEGSGWNHRTGHGILDAGAAVRHAIFAPGGVALALALVGLVFCVRRTESRELSRVLLGAGALAGACGLFFLRPLGLAELPGGELLCRSVADWDLVFLGADWHWNALWASALVPGFLGLISIPSRFLRALAIGFAIGWAARLATGIFLPYADVRFIPGTGQLDALWLGGNTLVLAAMVPVLVRLGRNRGTSL